MRAVDQTSYESDRGAPGQRPCHSRDVAIIANAKTRHHTVQGSQNSHTSVDANKYSCVNSLYVSKTSNASSLSVHRGSSLFSGVQATRDSKSSTGSTSSTRSNSSDCSSSQGNFDSIEADEDLFKTDVDSEDETVMVSNKEKESHHSTGRGTESTQKAPRNTSLRHATHSSSQTRALLIKSRNEARQMACKRTSNAQTIAVFQHGMRCKDMNVQFKPRNVQRNVKVDVVRQVESDDGTQKPLKPARGKREIVAPSPGRKEDIRLRATNKSTFKPKTLQPQSIFHLDDATMRKVLLWQKAKMNAHGVSRKQPREPQVAVRHEKTSQVVVTTTCSDAQRAPVIPHAHCHEIATSRKVLRRNIFSWQKAKRNNVQEVKKREIQQRQEQQAIVVHNNEKETRQLLLQVQRIRVRPTFERICI